MLHKKCAGFFIAVSFSCWLIITGTSCSYKQNQVLFEAPQRGKDTLFSKALSYDYKIEKQDVLQMRNLQDISYVYNVPGNGSGGAANPAPQPQIYQVENDSTVALPVIGKVKVAGLTKLEAAKKIQDIYADSVLKKPIIELKIINLKVSVFGEVKTPGNYPLVSDKTNLIDVLGQAGGLTDKANEKTIKIVRGGIKNPRVIMVDLSTVKTASNPVIVLQSQDIIYVAQNKRAIRNDKFQDISTIVQPGLLLLNTILIIFTLSKR
jgi:polysaccharide export outer membrane protein